MISSRVCDCRVGFQTKGSGFVFVGLLSLAAFAAEATNPLIGGIASLYSGVPSLGGGPGSWDPFAVPAGETPPATG